MVTIERKCPITGKWNTMELPISQWEYDAGMDAWSNGAYIQDAMPTLNADQREFIKTGITPDVWDSLFGSEE